MSLTMCQNVKIMSRRIQFVLLGAILSIFLLLTSYTYFEQIHQQLYLWKVVDPFPESTDDEILILLINNKQDVKSSGELISIKDKLLEYANLWEIQNVRIEIVPFKLSLTNDGNFHRVGNAANASVALSFTESDTSISTHLTFLKDVESYYFGDLIEPTLIQADKNDEGVASNFSADYLSDVSSLVYGYTTAVSSNYTTTIQLAEQLDQQLSTVDTLSRSTSFTFATAWLYQLGGNSERAIVLYDSLPPKSSLQVAKANNLGVAYNYLYDAELAYSYVQDAIALEERPETYLTRAAIRANLSKFDSDAIFSDYDRAIKIAPNYALAYISRGDLQEEHELTIAD